MNRILCAFPLLFLAIIVARADNAIIGTVSLTVDGEEQTWYVLESPADSLPSALWLAMGPDKGAIAVTAFDSFRLDEGPGEIRLTKIDANHNGPSAFSGTFSGVMRRGSGETITIENGRFEIEKAQNFERP